MPPEIATEQRGASGPPLLLIHGFPLDRTLWRAQLDALAPHARVVALDLPGFGESPPAASARVQTMEQHADAVLAVADALGFARFAVGGLSMGGYVALALARRAAARLTGLLLCDTRAEADAPAACEQRRADAARVLAHGHEFVISAMLPRLFGSTSQTTRPELVAHVTSMMRRATREAVAASLLGLAERRDARLDLALIALPTLVLCGEEDMITPPKCARALADGIPGARLELIAQAGHLAPLEAPDAVNLAIMNWLATLAPSHE